MRQSKASAARTHHRSDSSSWSPARRLAVAVALVVGAVPSARGGFAGTMSAQPVPPPAAIAEAGHVGGTGLQATALSLDPLLNATATGFGTIASGFTVGVSLTPPISLTSVPPATSLTVTFTNPPTNGVEVGLFTDTAQFTGFVSFAGSPSSVTLTPASNPTFFGGGGITGNVYNFVNLNNPGPVAWTPGLVTFAWERPAPIPSSTEWGLAALALLVGVVALLALRRSSV